MVRSFARTHYPNLTLHPKMVEQLSWLQNNSVNTSQSNVNLPKTPIDIEVKRTLSRLNSLTLLIEGGSSPHTAFVESHPKDNVLSEENFNRLSHFIQELSLGIWALKLELDQLWLNPDHPVIDNYLMFIKEQA